MPLTEVKTSIDRSRYRMDIQTATNQLVADEPMDIGGQDLGFAPDELLAASLGACTCATLRMYADRKDWPLEEVKVVVQFERDAKLNESFIHRAITLQGELSDEQRERLLAIANQCFIHKTLTHPIHIVSELKD